MTVVVPTLRIERELLREHPIVIACDEVGRGALAGPVAVGAAVVDARAVGEGMPEGLRDSKLIAEPRRPLVAVRAAAWTTASAIGWADAAEIDRIGIVRALGQAAARALEALHEQGIDLARAAVVLDGNHDYVSPASGRALRVTPVVKADRDCASAAAASVLAKVARDELMRALHDDAPVYEWARNKGYASAAHRAAIRAHGLSAHHRASWAISGADRP
ncbi:ribonuclease HII [Microbacterium sp. No. 7]|uniref:ribonuclease HII n=1 Tax=Microbacterium sp. No. 7 TaxID=1714373 RepID=UPI0006D10539|nr:ribonuclease HII [Microbacterium sp. No. 7]ALJ20327.1 ribonuclease HII [Microbacterium sp. No. 7]